jgi:peptidase M23-like protein
VPFRRLVCILLVAGVVAPATAARAATVAPLWRPPVDGAIARGFEPPATQYGSGHLGVDYRVARDSAVRAAGPGVVAFAGVVGGAVHVVVAHSNGLRTSYSFLLDATVHRGETVDGGDVVGHSGATGDRHDGTVVHFGLRVGNRYVDPLLLFQPPDLTKVVHLSPHRDPVLDSVAHERRGLVAGLVHAVAGVVAGTVRTVGAINEAELRHLEHLVRKVPADLDAISDIVRQLAIAPTEDTLAVARSLVQWAASLRSCDRDAPPADGTGGSGNRVMVVAGINSRRTNDGSSAPLPVDKLGYGANDVSYFSYSDDGGAYGPADTHEPIERAARQLRNQLRAQQRAHPGKPIDLIAHSQGGVVVMAFLLLYYRADDAAFPPLRNVVTLSSPLRGTPLAAVAAQLARTESGRRALGRAGLLGRSVTELTERSSVIAAIERLRLPDTIDLTTIGAAGDFVVPATNAHQSGSRSIDVDPIAPFAHSAVLRDPIALRAVRAALEHRAMPCLTFVQAVDAAVLPVAISRVERVAASAAALAS